MDNITFDRPEWSLTIQASYLTSVSQQELCQVRLFFRKYYDKVLKISNTSTSKKLQQFVIAVTRLYNVDDVISLRPCDTSNIRTSKLSDKRRVRVDKIDQMNTIDT